jgi:hypothetical protein
MIFFLPNLIGFPPPTSPQPTINHFLSFFFLFPTVEEEIVEKEKNRDSLQRLYNVKKIIKDE